MPRIDPEAPENEHAEGKDGKKRIGGTLTAAVTGEGILDGLHSGAHRVLIMVRSNSAAQSIGVEVVQFNSDQGSQFTSPRFTRVLKEDDVKISMDGKRQGSLDGQCLHRATLAVTQIRMRSNFIALSAPAFGARRANARRGLRGR